MYILGSKYVHCTSYVHFMQNHFLKKIINTYYITKVSYHYFVASDELLR